MCERQSSVIISFLKRVSKDSYVVRETALRMLTGTIDCGSCAKVELVVVESETRSLDFLEEAASAGRLTLRYKCCRDNVYYYSLEGRCSPPVQYRVVVTVVKKFRPESAVLNYAPYYRDEKFHSKFLMKSPEGERDIPFAAILGMSLESVSAYYLDSIEGASLCKPVYKCTSVPLRKVNVFEGSSLGSLLGKYARLYRDKRMKDLVLCAVKGGFAVKGVVVNSIVYGQDIVIQSEISEPLIQLYMLKCRHEDPVCILERIMYQQKLELQILEKGECGYLFKVSSCDPVDFFGELNVRLTFVPDLETIPVCAVNDVPTLIPAPGSNLCYRVCLNYLVCERVVVISVTDLKKLLKEKRVLIAGGEICPEENGNLQRLIKDKYAERYESFDLVTECSFEEHLEKLRS